MAMVLCKICQKEFYAKPSWLKNGNGIYCSVSCRNTGRKEESFLVFFVERRSINSERHLNDQNHKIISAAKYAASLGIMENLKKKNMVTGNMELLLIKEFLKGVTDP